MRESSWWLPRVIMKELRWSKALLSSRARAHYINLLEKHKAGNQRSLKKKFIFTAFNYWLICKKSRLKIGRGKMFWKYFHYLLTVISLMPAILTYNWSCTVHAWGHLNLYPCWFCGRGQQKSILQIETTFILANIFKLQVSSSPHRNQTLFCKGLPERVFSTTYSFLSLNQRDNFRFLVFHWWLHWEVCHG